MLTGEKTQEKIFFALLRIRLEYIFESCVDDEYCRHCVRVRLCVPLQAIFICGAELRARAWEGKKALANVVQEKMVLSCEIFLRAS